MEGGGGAANSTVGSIDFSGGGESTVVDLTSQVHQLPCCVKYDGPCSVSHYFKPKPTGVQVDGLNVEQAYFRGRMLQGTTLPLPEGYSGFVLGRKSSKKSKSYKGEENSNCWEMNARFQNITVWNHDSLPSQDDAFLRSFHWLTIAKAFVLAGAKTFSVILHKWICFERFKLMFSKLHQPVTAEDLESASVKQQPK